MEFSRTSSPPTSDPLKTAKLESRRCISSHHAAATSTKRLYKVQYSGEVIVSDRWRAEFGDEIKNADQHFRIIYLTAKPDVDDGKITAALKDARTVVCRPESLSEDTREAIGGLDGGGADETKCFGS